jgi:hypothetical protein
VLFEFSLLHEDGDEFDFGTGGVVEEEGEEVGGGEWGDEVYGEGFWETGFGVLVSGGWEAEKFGAKEVFCGEDCQIEEKGCW